MKRILFALMIIGFGFASCNKEPQPLSKQQIKQQIDSITNVRIKESDQQAQIDLSRRMKIEVKAKVDSILNATLVQKTKADSAIQAKKPRGIITPQQPAVAK